jgi:hypothetical protein
MTVEELLAEVKSGRPRPEAVRALAGELEATRRRIRDAAAYAGNEDPALAVYLKESLDCPNALAVVELSRLSS